MLILSRADVEALLDLDALVDAVAAAMADLSGGRASMPPRTAAATPDGILGVMPAWVPAVGALTTKLVSLFPGNAGGPLPTHQALIAAFDPSTGVPVAVMDGTAITAARTAAGSALSARLLARPDARVLAILGTGEQARAHARALPRVRDFAEIRVAGRDLEKAKTLAAEIGAAAAGTYAEALDGADVACATTHSPEPVVRREWLVPGMHVTSVGFNPDGPEVDARTIADALVVVETREAALAGFPVGPRDIPDAIAAGLITPDHIHAEIGELVAGTKQGRTTAEQITLYRSGGVAVQDAAAAALVLDAARARGAGVQIEL